MVEGCQFPLHEALQNSSSLVSLLLLCMLSADVHSSCGGLQTSQLESLTVAYVLVALSSIKYLGRTHITYCQLYDRKRLDL